MHFIGCNFAANMTILLGYYNEISNEFDAYSIWKKWPRSKSTFFGHCDDNSCCSPFHWNWIPRNKYFLEFWGMRTDWHVLHSKIPTSRFSMLKCRYSMQINFKAHLEMDTTNSCQNWYYQFDNKKWKTKLTKLNIANDCWNLFAIVIDAVWICV